MFCDTDMPPPPPPRLAVALATKACVCCAHCCAENDHQTTETSVANAHLHASSHHNNPIMCCRPEWLSISGMAEYFGVFVPVECERQHELRIRRPILCSTEIHTRSANTHGRSPRGCYTHKRKTRRGRETRQRCCSNHIDGQPAATRHTQGWHCTPATTALRHRRRRRWRRTAAVPWHACLPRSGHPPCHGQQSPPPSGWEGSQGA